MLNFNLDVAALPPQLDQLLQDHQHRVQALLQSQSTWTYDSLVLPLETLNNELHQFWAPISHLNSVNNCEALRAAYNQCLPKLSQHHTWIAQHKPLYHALLSLKNSDSFADYSVAQKTYINHELRDFILSGIDLDDEGQALFAQYQQALTQATAQFEEHLLDATDAWQLHIEEASALQGLPDTVLANFAFDAKSQQKTGYLLTLQAPCYQAVLTYADDAQLREQFYRAYTTRASDQGPQAGQFDNSPVMLTILHLRQQLAQLLGFEQYVDYALSTRMAERSSEVLTLLHTLLKAAKPFAEQDMQQLAAFAKAEGLITPLQPWDMAYYSERLKKSLFNLDDEQLRPYFPIDRVLQGLFDICTRLYDIHFTPWSEAPVWHPDVQVFKILDAQSNTVAYFYLDLYARAKKRGGAWMDNAIDRWQGQIPAAFLTCNFMMTPGEHTLLTHDEVVTLFHEFGHGLHHMLTEIDVLGVSGINGVAWDAVELPSQLMENWCWQAEALPLISQHFQTKDPLPTEMLQQLLKAKNFQAGLFLVRQLEFALFDFELHLQFDPQLGYPQIQQQLDRARNQCAVTPRIDSNRFQHSFSHIFAGGYGAGYYSYLWAEVLAQDAFAQFLEQGLFNPAVGLAFKQRILSKGGSEPMARLFEQFRGRAPDIRALLHSYGLS